MTLFESLKVQIGSAVTEQIVQQLLHTFTRQQLSETLLHESSAGSRVINKFLKILQLLVQEPAASFKAFLPNIIGLCMEQLYPIIIEVCSLHFEISTSSTFGDFPISAISSCVKKLKTRSYVLMFVAIVVPFWRENFNSSDSDCLQCLFSVSVVSNFRVVFFAWYIGKANVSADYLSSRFNYNSLFLYCCRSSMLVLPVIVTAVESFMQSVRKEQ